jgi:hypothetical protein
MPACTTSPSRRLRRRRVVEPSILLVAERGRGQCNDLSSRQQGTKRRDKSVSLPLENATTIPTCARLSSGRVIAWVDSIRRELRRHRPRRLRDSVTSWASTAFKRHTPVFTYFARCLNKFNYTSIETKNDLSIQLAHLHRRAKGFFYGDGSLVFVTTSTRVRTMVP